MSADCESGLGFDPIERDELRLKNGVLQGRSQSWELGNGWIQLGEAVGAPDGYLKGLDRQVREDLLNFHLARGDHYGKGNLTVVEHLGCFAGFARSDLQILSFCDVMDAIAQTIGDAAPSISVNRKDWANCAFEVELVCPRTATEVVPGDVLQAGLCLSHSALGRFATTVEVFVLRLLCGNGLIRRQCIKRGVITRTRRLPADLTAATKLQITQIQRLAANVWQQLPSDLASIERLSVSQVDVEELLSQYLTRSRMFSKRLRNALHEAWTAEVAEQTVYGAINALTHAATHDRSLSRPQGRALSRLAGVLANSSSHICLHCFAELEVA